jgi:hypothetical protein
MLGLLRPYIKSFLSERVFFTEGTQDHAVFSKKKLRESQRLESGRLEYRLQAEPDEAKIPPEGGTLNAQ